MMDDHQNMEMNTISSPRGGGSPSTHRWNPTKEQINMLETMYQQGIRTPSAEQIQDITTKLKVYGHIEGKNVFYWFQNHKARQRQKEKQDHRLAESFNRLFQHSPPLFPPPPCPNGIFFFIHSSINLFYYFCYFVFVQCACIKYQFSFDLVILL